MGSAKLCTLGTNETMYSVLSKPGTRTFETMHFQQKFDPKNGITHQCLEIVVVVITSIYWTKTLVSGKIKWSLHNIEI